MNPEKLNQYLNHYKKKLKVVYDQNSYYYFF